MKRNPTTGTFAASDDVDESVTIDLSQSSALTAFFPATWTGAGLTVYRLSPSGNGWVTIGRTIAKPATLPGYADLPLTEFTARNLRLVADNAADVGHTIGWEAKA